MIEIAEQGKVNVDSNQGGKIAFFRQEGLSRLTGRAY